MAAAAWVPETVSGICDSKKITKEEDRQHLFERLTASPGMLWAAAIMDAPYIDQVNILQATMHGMALAAHTLIHIHQNKTPSQWKPLSHIKTKVSYQEKTSVSILGCYVVTNQATSHIDCDKLQTTGEIDKDNDNKGYYALIDGNRLPEHMPCAAETMTKGDGREYSIAAASIVAKVVRDNLMRDYHNLYPMYNLQQHKGYPTAAHMALVRELGAVTPIHRRSFQPLKSMEFDKDGKLVTTGSSKKKTS